MIKITSTIWLDEVDIKFTFIRAQGPGGQNVNKLATAVQLRFDVVHAPSLSDEIRARILKTAAKKMTQKGEIIIKASRHRTQERNKQDALNRLREILKQAIILPKKRKKTRPTHSSIERRLAQKKLHGKTKLLRSQKPG